MKFGGASVAQPEQFAKIADLIAKRLNIFSNIAVVVSAMGKTTDELLQLAATVHPSPPKREQDMLISVGERVSISLLAMALQYKGIEAISFTGSQSGIITTEKHALARIIDVRPYRLTEQLKEGKIVIVAGFQGVSKSGEITTLGRGGSDTSAVALAIALGADRVEFYKDVPGICAKNPKIDPDATIYARLSFEKAIQIAVGGAEVLESRCLQLAEKNGIPLHIHPFYDPMHVGTIISSGGTRAQNPKYESEEAANV